VSVDGVWAFKAPAMVIPKPAAQISESDRNVFISSVYHRPRRLVQPNEAATVKLREGQLRGSAAQRGVYHPLKRIALHDNAAFFAKAVHQRG
jgi:hypothetical protein